MWHNLRQTTKPIQTMNNVIKNRAMTMNLRFIVIILGCLFAFQLSAQTSCDKLFASGVRLQQTMTIASQNKAITYFEKAKVCYDSQSKKDLCDQQITACRNIIAQLSKKTKTSTPTSSKPKEEVETMPAKPKETDIIEVKKDVQLNIDCTYLKFKGKGGEFKKAKIICNYPDWEIADKPNWVNCTKNDGEIVVEVEKNPSKEERSGSIIITCGDKSATLTIIQEKFKKFGVI